MRPRQEIESDAKKLAKDIGDIIDQHGHLHSFGPLATIAVLEAYPVLKERAYAIEEEMRSLTKP